MNPTVRFADTSPFRGGMGVMQAHLKGELSLKATEGFHMLSLRAPAAAGQNTNPSAIN